jgi:pullulanase/glycogen debranching enzyme
VNFITCHDGFTLRDLVSYERKHNEANLEENRDGHHENLSRSWGVEGPTTDAEIRAARARAARGLVATLALAQGVPMISHGDELGRSQLGNNNAYCHDSPLTWIDWHLDGDAQELLDYFRAVFRIRARHPAFRVSRFEDVESQVAWLEPLGIPSLEEPELPRAFGLRLAGPPALVALFNGEEEPRRFRLPAAGPWRSLVPTRPGLYEGEIEIAAHEVAVFEECAGARPA